MTVLPYSREMRIANTDQLPRGTGARYLEVSTAAPEGWLLAVQWRRTKPRTLAAGRALIQFGR